MNQKQKILIFHPSLAPYRIDQFNLVHEMYDLEVVFLFEKQWDFNLCQEQLKEACRFKISYLLHGPRLKGRLFRFGIYNKIRQVKPDFIFGYEYSFTTQYLILLKSLGLVKQKVGSFIDDSPAIFEREQSKTRRLARDYSVRRLDYLVVMSSRVSQLYRNRFGFGEKQVVVSPILQLQGRLRANTAKIETLARDYAAKYRLKGKKVLLFVGRFIPEKALSLFIETISPVLGERDDLLLVLVGEGDERENLSMLIKDKKLEDKILLPGKFQSEALYGWYACASGFVLPSLWEPFGAVVNEALIFGLTVLCSEHAGAASLVHSGNGLLFDPADSADALEKFEQYVNGIQPVGDVCLAGSPPLLENEWEKMVTEWKKVGYG